MRRPDAKSLHSQFSILTFVIAAYALLAILIVPVFPHFISANEFSRWILAVAVVDFHSVEVTRAVDATHTRNEDLAAIDGRLYSNKAPGGALVGLPAYAMARLFAGPPTPHNMRVTIDAMRLLASTVPVIMLALWLASVATRFGCSEDRARFAVAAMLFGTPVFAYGLLLFAHALSAFALFGAFALLFAGGESRIAHSRRELLAGALIGLGVLSEYPSAIPAVVLVACAAPQIRLRGLLRVIAGGIPFALVLGVYNRVAFGSFFTLSSAHESNAQFREMSQSGLFGVGVPSPSILFHLLFDPAKGLFIVSPVLLVALLGVRAAYRMLPRSTFVALVATPLSIVLTFAGYPNWHGGWSVGVRYLVPAIPFLALLIAFASRTIIEPLLFGASVVAVALVTLVFPFVGTDYPAPWISFAWPLLRDGHVAPNLLHFVARPLAIAVPFLIVAAAAFASVKPRDFALVIAGAAMWCVAGLAIERARDHPPNIRAVIEEVYFQDPGAIRRTLGPGDRSVPPLEAIARSWKQLPPDFWPY